MRFIFLVPVLSVTLGLGLETPSSTYPEPPSKRVSIPIVTASGNAFWQGNTRFYVRGLDYQPGGAAAMQDPLGDPIVCHRDIAEFKKLAINTIRVYITDNSVNHDECMNALADAGIYVILDVNNPLYSINRANPGPSYNTKYLQSVFATIDEFVKYDNTLAFFSGNEVVHDLVESTLAAPYVKAVTRDIRQYIRSRGYRAVPVGYSAADVAQNRMQLAYYMNCGVDNERTDFFAFNDYSWCNSDFVTAGWDQKVRNLTGYGIPIFLSEYGCLTNGRTFGEVAALMSSKMTSVYSGGLLYEYSMEANGYGIVKIPTPKSPTVQELEGFSRYAQALVVNPAPPGDGGFTSTTHSVPCPTKDANWLVYGTHLPAMPEQAKHMMVHGAGPGPGLKGKGSQYAVDGTSTGVKSPRSATATATVSATTSSGLASPVKVGNVEKAPIVVGALVLGMSLGGTLLL